MSAEYRAGVREEDIEDQARDYSPWAWHRRRGPWVCSRCDRLLLGPDAMCVACGDDGAPAIPLGHTGSIPVVDPDYEEIAARREHDEDRRVP